MIKGLVDDQGEKHEDLGKMKEMVREFYTNMFTSEVQEVDQGMIKALMPDVGVRRASDRRRRKRSECERERVRERFWCCGSSSVF